MPPGNGGIFMSSNDAIPYNMRETYGVNDKILHPSFNEVGVVKDVKRTSDNYSTCIVEFPTAGRKCLVMGATVSQIVSSI